MEKNPLLGEKSGQTGEKSGENGEKVWIHSVAGCERLFCLKPGPRQSWNLLPSE
jgi:hypothetical protein